jgi:hypothetical protein
MIIFHNLKLVFIHIPKTSGQALTHAVAEAFGDSKDVEIVWGNYFHSTARHIRNKYYSTYSTFSIIRNPYEIFKSNYCWMLRHSKECLNWDTYNSISLIKLKKYLLSCKDMTFEEFTINSINEYSICNIGGFYSTYCLPDTKVFKYEDIPYDKISQLLNTPLNMQVVNEAKDPKPEISDGLKSTIKDFCYFDFQQGFY